MSSLMSKEDWLKGVLGLNIVKVALIPTIKKHYKQRVEKWNTDDDHLKHLLDVAAKGEVKKTKEKGSVVWKVNCSDCRPILKEIEKSHIRPEQLMWKNNNENDTCRKDYRLARIYMPGGQKESKYKDLDTLTILEIIKNDKGFDVSCNEISFLILFRNRLMHSSTNCIQEKERDEAFGKMKKLLENDTFKQLEECVSAVAKLNELKEKNMIYDVDESNENWKLAIAIQEQANADVGTLSPEAFNKLLKEIQDELQMEKYKQEKLKTESEEKLSKAEGELSLLQNKLDTTEQILQTETTEKNTLQQEVEERTPQNLSFVERISKGAESGATVGLAGGPVGVAVGRVAGGVVGGLSYFWDKVSK